MQLSELQGHQREEQRGASALLPLKFYVLQTEIKKSIQISNVWLEETTIYMIAKNILPVKG